MTAAATARARAGGGVLKGWHVLAALIGFFGTVFAVNGVFLYMALTTHTGVVAVEPYRKGLHYNDRIAAEERQTQLGWELVAEQTVPGGPLRVSLTAGDGGGVSGLSIDATLGRPSTSRHDVRLVLVETSSGVFIASLAGLEPGAWILDIDARRPARAEPDGQQQFRARRRLWLKQ